MKKYLIFCMLLYTLFLGACQVKTPKTGVKSTESEAVHLEKAKNLEFEITYKSGKSKDPNGFYLKFIDDKHYVYMIDGSKYTEKDIKEKSEDGYAFYPYIYFTEGEHSKQGDNYLLKPIQTVKVEFKDANHVKNQVIASKKLDEENKNDRAIIIGKEDEGYNVKAQNGDFTLYKTNKKLPNSIDEFLSQYDYQPEELD